MRGRRTEVYRALRRRHPPMGSKAAARTLAQQAGVPVVPGSDGPLKNVRQAKQLAAKVGYPVLLKASAGGGGRGMRQVDAPEELEGAYKAAQAEAVACFGDGEMYLEKLVLNPRHIEFQIMADSQGHVVHLGERDCSIQRRRQKLMEESPSKALDPELRERMGAAAVAAAKAAGYVGAGTVEFVLSPEGEFYFIEMNTRIQVEHPVTELVTGIDLVKEQLRVAAGLPLSFTQEDVQVTGHAIECRINAEDPGKDFRPCPGKTEFLHLPGGPGVRVDTALYPGYEVPPFYDSLVAKVLVHGPHPAGGHPPDAPGIGGAGHRGLPHQCGPGPSDYARWGVCQGRLRHRLSGPESGPAAGAGPHL